MNKPIYLYTGPEFGEKDDALNALKSSFKKQFGSVDEHSFYLIETPFSQVMTILQSGTLFSDAVFVVCKGAELIKTKDDIATLKSWLDNPSENSLLVLISDEIGIDKKVEELVPPSNKKIFWEMFEDRKIPWIQNFFTKNGYSIQEDAASLILDMIENNTQALRNECSRFFVCFPKEHTITCDDVESILTHNREENAFSLFNAITETSLSAQERFENGLEILQKIRLSKENKSAALIAALSSCFRKLVIWHKLCPDGYVADSFELKKNGISGTTMQKQYKKAAKIWTTGQATAILAVLAQTDMEIRSGGTLLEDVLLEKMLYEIIVKKGASISKAEYE